MHTLTYIPCTCMYIVHPIAFTLLTCFSSYDSVRYDLILNKKRAATIIASGSRQVDRQSTKPSIYGKLLVSYLRNLSTCRLWICDQERSKIFLWMAMHILFSCKYGATNLVGKKVVVQSNGVQGDSHGLCKSIGSVVLLEILTKGGLMPSRKQTFRMGTVFHAQQQSNFS